MTLPQPVSFPYTIHLVPSHTFMANLRVGAHGPPLQITDILGMLHSQTKVYTLCKKEKGEDHYYFCTPTFLLMCRINKKEDETTFLIINLCPIEELYRLPNWLAIPVEVKCWHIGQYNDQLSSERISAKGVNDLFLTTFHRETAKYRDILQEEVRATDTKHTPEEKLFLERVRKLIDASRTIERQKALKQDTIVFTDYEASDASRNRQQTFIFHLADACTYQEGNSVRVGWGEISSNTVADRGTRGSVMSIAGRQLTIQFKEQVNLVNNVRQGLIVAEFNDIQQRTQAEALEKLRLPERKELLRVFACHSYQEYDVPHPHHTSPPIQNGFTPNKAQHRVMECARTFKDTFLVLGPPGTGKTKVITELVKNFKAQNLKVLVTSKNNKAVDNVLERLAHQPDIQAIRVGQESKVDEPVKPFLLDVQARALQDQIRARTEEQYQRLLNAAQTWERITPELLMGLQVDLRRYTDFRQGHVQAYKTVQERQQCVWNSFQRQLEVLVKQMHDTHSTLTRHVARYNRKARTLATITWLCRIPVIGQVFNPLKQWQLQRAQHHYDHTRSARATFYATVTSYNAQIAQIQTDVYGSDWILEAKQQCQQHEKNASHLLTAMHSRITRIHGSLPNSIPLPPIPPCEIGQIRGYIEHIGAIRRLSLERLYLMEDWRGFLQERRASLHSTLLRFADVIGATCIGIATKAEFKDLKFGVVIADEAGQIQVFDLLVPLVRGQRAILVGDHKQLPPVIEPEMLEYLENEEDEEIRNLGKKSIFELLFVQAQDTHRARLNVQHRMPASIANFISQEFYENEYFSPDSLQNDPPDPFFQRAFCFIDTLHRRSYRDTRVQDEEEENATGFFNVQEARVLARLAEAYFKQHYCAHAENSTDKTIGIIVPYKRQVKQVANELRQRQLPDDIVATVDAFQGNERDVILFGFTRSNKYGGIGFLNELRRLNVTLTRAKSHIILVGDRRMLCNANDEAFRTCANNLMTYIEQYGQMLTIDDIDRLLRSEESRQYGSVI